MLQNVRSFVGVHVKALVSYSVVALVVALYAMPQMFAHASVAITIDTDTLFTSVNTWISTFIGPLSIGIGIAIALALITFIGSKIVDAFRGAR